VVESKDFELLVVGGETGVCIRKSCKGSMRSILMDRDGIAWLVRIFEELVVGEDSRVFWNQYLGFQGFLLSVVSTTTVVSWWLMNLTVVEQVAWS
jgi:hypothetical protein